MNFLSWIGDLVELIISFVPHLEIMRANHGGVKFKRGGKVEEIKPGLYWYWPIVTETMEIATKRQTISLDVQTLPTTDDKTVTAAAVIVYEINDVIRALAHTWDTEDTLGDVAQYAVVECVTKRSFAEICAAMTDEIPMELKEKCRRDLKQFGILVKSAFLSDCACVKAYRVMGDGVSMLPEPDEED